ncbi:dihydrodipicolinate reductase [Streptomyces sp. NBC_00249]|uniref:Gfo/Idh/MocA family oxidoreductase n=1 Tax=Streptomyces sp. NBC_00249 TaxID=2975690 RepID=UPI00225AF917|nr:Gfo/Idh/MocA family oxidoreductase [Streptomyces sp. NBC_00249]MCX5195539.1 dihydrodipicolinate reductase [Streptomyces sp. NBC_00249]
MTQTGSATKVAVYGPGAMGLHVTRMLHARGLRIVAALTRPGSDKVGRDLGTLAGIAPLGVPVRDDAERALAQTAPDIVVVTVSTYLDETQYEIFATAVRAGANVITLAEEMLYPFPTAAARAEELDELARRHGVTVTGTGHQDAYWVNLVSVLAGSADRLEKVEGRLAWNVDDFGPALAKQQQVGATVAEFDKWLADTARRPTFGRSSLYALAATAGLTPGRAETRTTAVVATRTTPCEALGQDIAEGRVLGYTDTDTLHTEEGVELVISSTGKVYGAGESDFNEWRTTGTPALHLRNEGLITADTTCATLVNRIPQVLEAQAGIVTIDRLPQLRYRPPFRSTATRV